MNCIGFKNYIPRVDPYSIIVATIWESAVSYDLKTNAKLRKSVLFHQGYPPSHTSCIILDDIHQEGFELMVSAATISARSHPQWLRLLLKLKENLRDFFLVMMNWCKLTRYGLQKSDFFRRLLRRWSTDWPSALV